MIKRLRNKKLSKWSFGIGASLLCASSLMAQNTGYIEQFGGGAKDTWGIDPYNRSAYTIDDQHTKANDELKIHVNAAGGCADCHEYFYLQLPKPIDLSKATKLSLKYKAWGNTVLRVDLEDIYGRYTSGAAEHRKSLSDGQFHNYYYDFSQTLFDHWGNPVDATKISKIRFYVNSGTGLPTDPTVQATDTDIYIDNIIVGTWNQTYFLENFADWSLDGSWKYDSGKYTLNESNQNQELLVTGNWVGANYEPFMMDVQPFDMEYNNNHYLHLKVKSDEQFQFRADIQDIHGTTANYQTIVYTVPGDGKYHDYTFDFSDRMNEMYTLNKVDGYNIGKVLFYVNPGGEPFSGSFYVDEIEIGAKGTENHLPFLNPMANHQIPNGGEVVIDLNKYFFYDDFTPAHQIDWSATATDLNVSIVGTRATISAKSASYTGVTAVVFKATDADGLSNTITGFFEVEGPKKNGLVDMFEKSTDDFKYLNFHPYPNDDMGRWWTNNENVYNYIDIGAYGSLLNVSVYEAGMDWQGDYTGDHIYYDMPEPIDMRINSKLSIQVKLLDKGTTATGHFIRIDLEDDMGVATSGAAENIWVDNSDSYQTIYLDFAGKFKDYLGNSVDASSITKVKIYVNEYIDYGQKFTGNIHFDNLVMGNWNPTYIYDNFADGAMGQEWYASPGYDLTEQNEECKVQATRVGEDFESFNFNFQPVTLNYNQDYRVNMNIKSDKEFVFRVDLQDIHGVTTNDQPIEYTIPGDGEYHNYTFDFSDRLIERETFNQLDAYNVKQLLMYANPGGPAFTGTFYIDEVIVGGVGDGSFTPENHAPILRQLPDMQLPNGGSITVDLANAFYYDDFSEESQISWAAQSSDLSVLISGTMATITAKSETFGGLTDIEFIAKDAGSATSSITVAVEVEAPPVPNVDPIISNISDQTIAVGESFNTIDLNLYVSDETLDENLVWSTSTSSNLSVSISAGIATVTPLSNTWSGTETITFTVKDEENASSAIDVDFTISATPVVNQAPVLSSIPAQTVYQETAFTAIDLSAYVSDDAPISELTWTITTGTNITATITGTTLSAVAISDTWYGTESFTITVTDSESETASVQVTFNILEKSATNATPIFATISEQTIKQGEQFGALNLASYVTDDEPIGNLTWSVSGNSNIQIQLTGSVVSASVADASWYGTEAITFTVTDGSLEQASTIVDYTVLQNTTTTNTAPVLAVIPAQTVYQEIAFTAIDLTQFVTDDAPISELTWTISTGTNITASISGTTLTAIAKSNTWYGTESFTITVTDSELETASVQVTYNVLEKTGTNATPIFATISEQAIKQGEQFQLLNLATYVTDDEPIGNLTWSVSGNSNIQIQLTGSVVSASVTDASWYGTEAITFTVTDGSSEQASTIVDFTVLQNTTATNTAPVLATIPEQIVYQDQTFSELVLGAFVSDDYTEDSDIQWSTNVGTNITVTIIDGKATAQVLSAVWSGSETITFTATDGENASTSVTVKYTVIEKGTTNLAPVVSSPSSPIISEDGTFDILDLAPYITDEDPSSLDITGSSNNLNITIIDRKAVISLKDQTWSGTELVTITVTDSQGLSSEMNIIISVTSSSEVSIENTNIEVSAYPNPSNGIFTVSSETPINSITVVDLFGKPVLTLFESNADGTFTVSLLNTNQATYLLQVNMNDSIISQQIIIE